MQDLRGKRSRGSDKESRSKGERLKERRREIEREASEKNKQLTSFAIISLSKILC